MTDLTGRSPSRITPAIISRSSGSITPADSASAIAPFIGSPDMMRHYAVTKSALIGLSELERLKDELEWVRSNPKARQAKGKARINAYEELMRQDSEKLGRDLEIYIPPGPRLGNLVIEAKNVTKAFGDKVLLDN